MKDCEHIKIEHGSAGYCSQCSKQAMTTNWKEQLVGKNIHSVYTHCLSCHTWGINLPLEKVCGNCGKDTDTYTYYDSETISSLLEKQREDWIEKLTVLKAEYMDMMIMAGPQEKHDEWASKVDVIKDILSELTK